MDATLYQIANLFKDERNGRYLRKALGELWRGQSSVALNSAGLVIHGSTSTLAKTGASDFYAIAKGTLVKIAASTDMPALVGSITAANFNVFSFFIDNAGTVTVAMGTEATTIAGVKFPPKPDDKALVGFLLVTYASTFVGGTTALDTATTVYFSPTAPFDQTLLVGT